MQSSSLDTFMTSLHVCHHFPICPWGGSLDAASKDKALLSLIVIVQQSSSFVFAWLCIVLRCRYYCSVSESESHFQQVLIDSLRYSMLNSLELTQVIHVLVDPVSTIAQFTFHFIRCSQNIHFLTSPWFHLT